MRGYEILLYLYDSNNTGTKTVTPGSKPPRTEWKPHPHWAIVDWVAIAHKASAPRGA